jgi:tRNA nucleotidyltransferase/poly(A) polymerase
MPTKYHISDSGKVVPCLAAPGKCPKQNFDSTHDAEEHMAQQYGGATGSRRAPKGVAPSLPYPQGSTTPYTMALPTEIEDLLDTLNTTGTPLIVGGSVRDSLEGKEVKDYDIEVYGVDMDSLANHLKKNGYVADEVGKQFGVLKVHKGNLSNDEEAIDVSVPRRESTTGAGGHRGFDVEMDAEMTAEEAAQRRDFTFNALMYDHRNKVIVDTVGGLEDYNGKVMRHVSHQFAEDPLRVLRGFQFAARFDMEYAPETAQLCKSIRGTYDSLAQERLREEWGKFFTKGQNHVAGVRALQASGWDDITPGLKDSLGDPSVQSALSKLSTLDRDQREFYGAAVIASKIDEEHRTEFLEISMKTKDEQQRVYNMLRNDPSYISHSSYHRKTIADDLHKMGLSYEHYGVYGRLTNNRDMVAVYTEASADGVGAAPERPFIQGRDIIEFSDAKPGKWTGELIAHLKDQQYRGKFSSREEAVTQMRAKLPEYAPAPKASKK